MYSSIKHPTARKNKSLCKIFNFYQKYHMHYVHYGHGSGYISRWKLVHFNPVEAVQQPGLIGGD